jgi:hypothetical protein
MESKPHVLAAFPVPALLYVEKTLGSYVQLIPAHTFEHAVRCLREDHSIALVTCGVFFDESRMFDLMRWVTQRYPKLPFIACRVLPFEIPRVSIEALKMACASINATYVDVVQLEADYGSNEVEADFRAAVLSHLVPADKAQRG